MPQTASFGPEGQYYLEFPDQRYWRIKDPTLSKLVQQHATQFVSFGPKGATFRCAKKRRILLLQHSRGAPKMPSRGRARSGDEDRNRVASVTFGSGAYFVTFRGGSYDYKNIPMSMHEYIREHIKPNSDVFEQVSFSQDLVGWYLRTNKRSWYRSSVLRNIEDKYKPASLQVDKNCHHWPW